MKGECLKQKRDKSGKVESEKNHAETDKSEKGQL